MKKTTVAVAGLGNRGNDIYAHYQLVAPEEMQVVAVADPVRERREEARRLYGVKPESCFETAEELLGQPRLADACVIATQDQQHVSQAVEAIKKGYHVLCEKPISPSLEDCLFLQRMAHQYQRVVAVGHVLRYTPFYSRIKEILDSGEIGEVVNIQAMEQVAYWHQAHSFVRGNWRNSQETSPMILAKCCHDLDLFAWLLDRPVKKVSSFGGLYLFKPEKAPRQSAMRCLSGCRVKEDCPYDAEKIYITNPETGILRVLEQGRSGDEAWPVCVLSPNELTEEAIYRELQEGPYGRCVYQCDNDVVDHQVVNLEFEGQVTVNFTMTAFTAQSGRSIHINGTKGDLVGNLKDHVLTVTQYGKKPKILSTCEGDMSGHAGGDNRLIHDFLTAVQGEVGENALKTGIDVSIQSHIMALASEYSRQHGGKLVEIEDFLKKYQG